ncbi:12652_t:CDS:1, partial [Entrophospora sp. SA101]
PVANKLKPELRGSSEYSAMLSHIRHLIVILREKPTLNISYLLLFLNLSSQLMQGSPKKKSK